MSKGQEVAEEADRQAGRQTERAIRGVYFVREQIASVPLVLIVGREERGVRTKSA